MEGQNNIIIPVKYFNSVCRICLTESELLIPIYEINLTYNLNSEGLVKTIPLVKVLHQYCNVMVYNEDKKPQKICEPCMEGLCQAYNVLELFVESNTILNSMLQKNKIQEVEKKISLLRSVLKTNKNNVLDMVPSNMKLDIPKDEKNNMSCPVAYVDLINQTDSENNENVLVLLENQSSAGSEEAMNFRFDSKSINIKKEPSDGLNMKKLSDSDMEDIAYEVGPNYKPKHKVQVQPVKIPPICFIDPRGLLRDHTYAINERTMIRFLRRGIKRKRKRKPRPKKPKKEKVKMVKKVEVSEYKKRLIERRLQKRLEIENHIFKCRFCDLDLKGMERVVEHIKEKHLWTTRCILCPKILKRYDFVLLHLQSHAKYGHICRSCHLFFKDKKSLESHKESAEHKGPFLCNICNKTYKSHDRLKIHIEVMHGGNSTKKYKCSQCDYLTKWKNNLYNHLYTHQALENRKRYLCQHCARRFTSSYSLKFHIRKVHEGQTHLRYNNLRTSLIKPRPPPASSYQCEICANIFKYERSFFKHRLTHPEASINCPYCDRVLENPTEYKEHRRSEHSKFACDVCRKRFPTKHQLAVHTSNFHVSKTYTCQECYIIFKSAQTYRQHILIHGDKRPHLCEFCGQTFRQQAHKRAHIDTVHGQKKFKCNVCGKAFVYESILRDHMRTHTGEKPFACLYCTKMFRDTVSRHKHVKNDHREKMEQFLIYKKKHQEEEVRKANNQEETPDDLEETYSGEETETD